MTERATSTVSDVYDLTPLQHGMLFHALLEPESAMYFEQITIPFDATLDWRAFEDAWQAVAAHHDVFRASFHWEGIAQPVQVIRSAAHIEVAAVDLIGAVASNGIQTLADFQDADRARGFNLEVPPLFRVTLVRHSAGQIALVLSFHHLILDGWSLQIVMRDFATVYRQLTSGAIVELPPAGRFRDYLVWLTAQDTDAAERHWRAALHEIEGPTPLWSEPSAPGADAFAEYEVVLSSDTTLAAERAATSARVTLNTVVQATWALTMARSTGNNDQTFGMTVSGRPSDLSGVEHMVGLFINTIPLRIRIDPNAVVTEWLRDVQRRSFEARQFESTALVDAQRWSGLPAGTPLFDNILAFENYPVSATGAGTAPVAAVFAERTNYPLSAAVVPGDALKIRLLHDQRVLAAPAVRRVAERFELLLQAFASHPTARLCELATSTADDAAAIALCASQQPKLPNRPVHELFERHADTRPDAPALDFDDVSITYGRLNAAADHVADELVRIGVEVGDHVAILLDRSAAMIATMLATLKVGAVYVPLDPENSLPRLTAIVAQTRPRVIVTSREHSDEAGLLQRDRVVIDDLIDSTCASPPDHDTASPRTPRNRAAVTPDDPAYVMFTSGSTGEPKGIVVPHRAIIRLVCESDYVQIGPTDGVAHLANCSFDAATFEVWGPLLNGARVVGIDRDTAIQPELLGRRLREHAVSIAFLTTALFNRIVLEYPEAFDSLEVLMFGGEAVDPNRVRTINARSGPARLLHVYGPTECTTFATWHEVRDVADHTCTVPIGGPIANTTAHVLDESMQHVAAGSVGELYLGGAGLAHGYLGRPRETATSFVPDPFRIGQRLYRTGDRVRPTPTGIEFVGRFDHQVKIRGFRVEPGELETVLAEHPDVSACIVIVRRNHDGEHELVAYVAAEQSDPATVHGDLRAVLRDRLPRYMHPTTIMVLPTLPLNRNGKIDRDALPAAITTPPDAAAPRSAPSTDTESRLAAIWSEVLGVERVGVHDDFFELGGHSLRATQLVSRIRRDFGTDIALRAIFDHPTIAELAHLIVNGQDGSTGQSRIERIERVAHRPAPDAGRGS